MQSREEAKNEEENDNMRSKYLLGRGLVERDKKEVKDDS
jgi:hypothetical protein